MIESTLHIIAGLVLLFFGGEALVRGASSLALRLGLTPLVVGLTVVAFGTSAPEMVVSTKAALVGQGDIAVGNVVGSNIFNVAVILGLSALISPLRVQLQLLKLDVPMMAVVSLATVPILWNGHVSRLEGAILITALVAYTAWTVVAARRQTLTQEVKAEFDGYVHESRHWFFDVAFILGGLALLIFGSRWLVQGSIEIARAWGVSEAVIGLTIVAAGTSMPEVAASLVAAYRKQHDIAIGNVVGSNTFNILGILGVSALVRPLDAPNIIWRDVAVMAGVALLLLPLMRSRWTLARGEGALLVAIYLGYLFWLWPKAN